MDIIVLLVAGFFLFNLVHESGHYFAHRITGVKMGIYHLGVGPRIREWTDGSGGQIRLGLIPVASVEYDPEAFKAAPPLRRALIAACGPLANFMLMFVLFLVAHVFFPVSPTAVIDVVDDQRPAALAGLKSGDRILAVDGVETDDWQDVGLRLAGRIGDTGTLSIQVEREKESLQASIPITNWQSQRVWIDVFDELGIQPHRATTAERRGGIGGLITALVDCVRMGFSSVMAGFDILFGDMSVANFTGGLQTTQLGVPSDGLAFEHYLLLLGLFSFVFGMINSLPGPIVDGLDVIRGVYDWVRGRPLGDESARIWLFVGILFSFGLIPIIVVHEIIRFS